MVEPGCFDVAGEDVDNLGELVTVVEDVEDTSVLTEDSLVLMNMVDVDVVHQLEQLTSLLLGGDFPDEVSGHGPIRAGTSEPIWS